jgi:mannan endo-1,4-beta-mannosidase
MNNTMTSTATFFQTHVFLPHFTQNNVNASSSPWKKIFSLTLLWILGFGVFGNVEAQLGSTISVSGPHILGPCGDTLVLRGVNYAPYNWGWSPNQLRISEIAQSGANCVRLVWYKNPASGTPTTTYTNLTNLDSLLSKCIQHQLIPILDLHDLTCQNSPSALINLATWYTGTAVNNLIQKYKHSLILNIANECLYVNWTGNPTTSQNAFVSTYSSIVSSLRNQNITVPLMIDGPDCGQNLDVLTNIGNTLQNNDVQHNLIFSAHAYWYLYANNDSLTMLNKINAALAANIPLVLGEIANTQDDATMCQYPLNYKALLHICKNKKIGWMAWSWDNDGCPSRQVTTAGQFANLTAYGQEIIYNPYFGLNTNPPAKSMFLQLGGCRLSIRAWHEGLYVGSTQQMISALAQTGGSIPPNVADSVEVSVHAGVPPYAAMYSMKTRWFTNGWILPLMPLSVIGTQRYYVIKHRNSLETWSATPWVIRATLPYDFTTAGTAAYGGNLISLPNNQFGLYSGDINQDGQVDAMDYIVLDADLIQSVNGYVASDLNGDGVVDAFDYLLLDPHVTAGVGTMQP